MSKTSLFTAVVTSNRFWIDIDPAPDVDYPYRVIDEERRGRVRGGVVACFGSASDAVRYVLFRVGKGKGLTN